MFSRRLLAALLLLLFVTVSAQAQTDSDDETPFPTLTALQETVIPRYDATEAAARLRGVTNVDTPDFAGTLAVGTQQNLWVSNSASLETFQVPATLLAVGETCYIWIQDDQGVTADAAQRVADMFDTRVYNQVRDLWGSEANPGIDGDPRLHILFARNLGPGTGAYFAQRHTYPDAVKSASNEREMFVVSLDAYRPDSSSIAALESVLAHEFQHMIRFNLDGNEDTWLNEGLSTFTEFYLGSTAPYRYPDFFLPAPDTQLNTFGLSNVPRAVNYGAGFMFITYFYERFGDEAIRKLSAQTANGLIAVDTVLRDLGVGDADSFFADFALANLIQDASIADGIYDYPESLPMRPVPVIGQGGLRNTWVTSGNQYSTTYYDIAFEAGSSVTVSLDMPESVRLIPTDAASGSRMWYSNRGDTSNMTLTRAFDLRDVSSATLEFKAWYAIEEFWDYAYVMASTDDGASWNILRTPQTTFENPFGNSQGAGYTGYTSGWIDQSVTLDAYAGQEILLRFEYITDDAVNEPGFALDDVRIDAVGYSSDFEADDGGWESAGWLLIDNRLPQQAWVQVVEFTGDDVAITRWLALGSDSWTLDVDPAAQRVVIAVSPFAPVTTVPVEYTLSVD